jgi:uncharacterized protein (TIGR02466 family)
MMKIEALFPTPVGFFTLDKPILKTESNFILKQKTRPNTGNLTSENYEILNAPQLKRIKAFVEASVDAYFKDVYSPAQKIKLRITQSWCNYSKPGQWHHRHAHPNSFISGVLYVQSDPEKDKIFFHKTGFQQLKTPVKDWNTFNSDSWWFEAIPNRLVIFPSSLEHSVEIVQGDLTRVSLSFNTFPVGHWGEDISMTGLNL